MKLDERIKDDYKILTCFDTVQAKQYVGTKGYFHERLEGFSDLAYCVYGTMEVNKYETATKIFHLAENGRYYKLFLPEKFIKEKQKKYRSYKDIEEFCNQGFQMVVFRKKQTEKEHHVLFNGYRLSGDGACLVILGNLSYGLKELFIEYEILDSDGIWKPFGVEE